jgi:signal transduction histidine kinase
MLDVMAHEIRQPLNNASAALQGAARALAQGGEQPAQPRVASAQRVLGEVLSSIDNTLAVAALLARPEAIERMDTDLDMLINLVLAELPAAERPRVRVQRDTRTRTASMDMSLMRLALRNLLSNALRYSPPGTPVVLRVADSDDPLALLLDVRNAGSGIAEDFVPRLFERRSHQGLQRASSARGMGLGLYIVRRVLELHGGSAQLLTNGPAEVAMRLVLNQPTD